MSANMLKMIALITMTIDHVGLILFPGCEWMRILGRIAFPIFAFMIAEGCRYTHNRLRYWLQIALMGIGMQVVLFVATGSLYQSVFVSFTLAIMLIYAIDRARNEKKYWFCVVLALWGIMFACVGLPEILHTTDYKVDYSIIGVLIPVVCYLAKDKRHRLIVFTLGLVALSAFYGEIQWFCLLAVPLIGMYNNQKGRYRLKNLFYLYYPVHLSVLFVVEKIMEQ